MEKKNECDIVQDLLLSYCDDTLSSSSKKLVEEHLKNCVNCQAKLKTIRDDIKQSHDDELKEIDYLKKIRRKTRVKSIVLAICIILAVLFAFYIYNFSIVNSIANRATKNLNYQNFYREAMTVSSNNSTSVVKTYYKDGKYKMVFETYSDEGKKVNMVKYATVGSDEYIVVYENNKEVTVYKGDVYKIFNSEDNIKFSPFVSDLTRFFVYRLSVPFMMSISSDTFDVGREYYVFKNRFSSNDNWEMWVDKESGLTVREISRNSTKSFYPGTNVTKSVSDTITSYSYEFNGVTDEDVAVPSFDGYIVTTIEDDNG